MFFTSWCCCAKSRKEGEEGGLQRLSEIEQKLRGANRLLVEFVSEEQRIGLKETPCIDLIEKVLINASN